MTRTLTTLTIIAGLLVGLLLAACGPRAPIQPAPTLQARGGGDITGITHFNNLSTTDLTVADDATVADALTAADLTISDDLTVTDDTTISGNLSVAGAAILDDTNIAAATTTLTPTLTTYHVDSADDATLTLTACSVNGQLLILYGDDVNDVTIADSHIRTSTGSALTLGQYDAAVFVCMDTEWVQIALSANS